MRKIVTLAVAAICFTAFASILDIDPERCNHNNIEGTTQIITNQEQWISYQNAKLADLVYIFNQTGVNVTNLQQILFNNSKRCDCRAICKINGRYICSVVTNRQLKAGALFYSSSPYGEYKLMKDSPLFDAQQYIRKFVVIDNRCYAISRHDGMYYSSDGENWQKTSDPEMPIDGTDICYDEVNDVFIATTEDNGIYGSDDGVLWTKLSYINSRSIATANGITVAGGTVANQGLYYTDDGVNWHQSNITDGEFRTVCVGKYERNLAPYVTIFLAAAWPTPSIPDVKGMYRSIDGKVWEKIEEKFEDANGNLNFYDICYCNEKFVACTTSDRASKQYGSLWTSTNGNTWFKVPNTEGYHLTVFLEDEVVMIGNGNTWVPMQVGEIVYDHYYSKLLH